MHIYNSSKTKILTRLSYFIIVILISIACSDKTTTYKPILKNNVDSLSYYLGIYTGYILKDAGYIDFNKKKFKEASNFIFKSTNSNLEEYLLADSIIDKFINRAREKQEAITLKEGRDFLAKNKLRTTVHITASGLQYEIFTEGTGLTPKINDYIVTNFRGTTLEGQEFINNSANGPDTTLYKNATPGGLEAIKLMKEGAKYRFFVPSELAYGKNPLPGGIMKPNMTLIYEIELIKVLPSKN